MYEEDKVAQRNLLTKQQMIRIKVGLSNRSSIMLLIYIFNR